jgi:predicted ATP-dependent serine protease
MSDVNDKSQKLYICKECGLHYESEDMMEKCRAWCAEYSSCNLDITKHSIESQHRSKQS